MLDDDVELVAMDHEIGLALRRGVHRAVDELHLAEIGAQILAQELVVIARQHHELCAGERLGEEQFGERVIFGRPMPALGEPPAVQDIAHEVDDLRLVPVQEIDELAGACGPHAEVHVRDEQGPHPPGSATLDRQTVVLNWGTGPGRRSGASLFRSKP